ncbi:hypothetical protein ACFLZW_06985, partial [Chloroflexota bacterium]
MEIIVKKIFSRRYILVGLVAAISLSSYLLASHLVYRIGFPLDDAWIHQTYARNLANNFEWSFIPGNPSAGSTAPFWSALLALGYLLGLAPYIWSYLLGCIILVFIAVQGMAIYEKFLPNRENSAVWVGLFLALEWHLVWAAASGMETILAALLIFAVINHLLNKQINWLTVGILVGLSVWIRPDGLTLFGPVIVAIVFRHKNWLGRLRSLGYFSIGFALFIIPYLSFNRMLAGAWWPNTLFAKQAEYALLRQEPLLNRYIKQLSLPLVGSGAILLPGLIYFLVRAVRQRRWVALAGVIWML